MPPMDEEPLPKFEHFSEVHVLRDGQRGGWSIELIGLDQHMNEVNWKGNRLFLQGVEEILAHYRKSNSSF